VEVSAMPQVTINYVAVVVSALVLMALGAVWYAPPLFGNVWMQLIGKKPEDVQKGSLPRAYVMMFISALVLSFALAHVLRWAGAATAVGGIKVALAVWIGFVLTTNAGSLIFEGRPAALYWINTGYYGVGMILIGLILTFWK
jgi:Protein of unknown function (DUF1761)